MIPPALVEAGNDLHLRGAPLAVLVWLWSQLEPHGYRVVKVGGTAHSLRIKRDTVGRAIRILVDRGYLDEGPAEGPYRTFRVLVTRKRLHDPENGHSRAS